MRDIVIVEHSSSSPEADVYADDMGGSTTLGQDIRGCYLFLVDADAEPSAFGCIASVFNIANMAPQTACLERRGVETLHFGIEFSGMTERVANSLCRKLMQLTSVTNVSVRNVAARLQSIPP